MLLFRWRRADGHRGSPAPGAEAAAVAKGLSSGAQQGSLWHSQEPENACRSRLALVRVPATRSRPRELHIDRPEQPTFAHVNSLGAAVPTLRPLARAPPTVQSIARHWKQVMRVSPKSGWVSLVRWSDGQNTSEALAECDLLIVNTSPAPREWH